MMRNTSINFKWQKKNMETCNFRNVVKNGMEEEKSATNPQLPT